MTGGIQERQVGGSELVNNGPDSTSHQASLRDKRLSLFLPGQKPVNLAAPVQCTILHAEGAGNDPASNYANVYTYRGEHLTNWAQGMSFHDMGKLLAPLGTEDPERECLTTVQGWHRTGKWTGLGRHRRNNKTQLLMPGNPLLDEWRWRPALGLLGFWAGCELGGPGLGTKTVVKTKPNRHARLDWDDLEDGLGWRWLEDGWWWERTRQSMAGRSGKDNLPNLPLVPVKTGKIDFPLLPSLPSTIWQVPASRDNDGR
ncbi:hypothetical protein F5Y14DRAFT_450457 [Nemania sp. NC0429]|nr:hypothetical protein F5Y14DRAFT_450457 [Nemania sp. NC0429]